jgi:hypothetical protein
MIRYVKVAIHVDDNDYRSCSEDCVHYASEYCNLFQVYLESTTDRCMDCLLSDSDNEEEEDDV